MTTDVRKHPYLDLFIHALVPAERHGPDHGNDPPALLLLGGTEEARHVLDMLREADHGIRDDHHRTAAINLDLAATRIRMAILHGDRADALEVALTRIAHAQAALAGGDTRRACAALADAMRAVMHP